MFPREKRTKLEPLGKKGTFAGYSETSKAYKIHISGQRKIIEISIDVTFDEEATCLKSSETHIDKDREEQEAPKDIVMIESTLEEHIPKDQDETIEPEILVDPPK